MSVVFEFRRHSIKDGEVRGTLGPKGYEFARAVASQQIREGAFTHVYGSKMWRTQQTLAAFHESAQDLPGRLTPFDSPIYLDWPSLHPMWKACGEAERRGEDMLVAAIEYDPNLVKLAAAEVTSRFVEWSKMLPTESRVLVVGHSPYMEFIPLGLLNEQIPSLAECQAFRIVCVNDHFKLDTTFPFLNPASIRERLFGKGA